MYDTRLIFKISFCCSYSETVAVIAITYITRASLVAKLVRNLPTMQETLVQSLGWEDPLEEEMATHSSILPGKSHGQRSL